ncbi:MAG: zinc-binding dehydrogenase [Thermomicrobiales bacterium]|nr:zinc-binding dehydrogenase [Thermomicrobiales bacterium]
MQHWYVTGPGRIECEEEPTPVPAAGEALVRLAYTALSPGSNVHVFQTGTYHPSFTGGRTEALYMGSGIVEAVGPGVDESWIGTPVAMNGTGHQAHAAVPITKLHRIPDGLSLRDASLAYLSAWSVSALHLGNYAAAETVVVVGQGLVGASAALVADQMGARVLALDTAPDRVDFARGLGIGRVELTSAETEIETYLGSAGPDLLIETSGSWHGMRQAIALARDYSRIAVMGIYRTPPPPDLGAQLFGEAFAFPSKFHYQRLQIIGCGSDPDSLAEPMPRTATKSRNFAYVLGQAARGKLPLGKLVTNEFPADQIEPVIARFAAGDRSMVGVVFDWRQA